MIFRQFATGAVEGVVKVIKPTQQDRHAVAARSGWESVCSPFDMPIQPKKPKTPEEIEFDRHANWRRAVRAARQKIRFLVKEMGCDRLFTLTYRENVQDREQVKKDFTKFLRLVRKTIPDWGYVAVLERQDRGAFHIHCAVKGWQRITVLRRCWYQALGGRGDETGADTPGQVDVTKCRRHWGNDSRTWRPDKLAGYLTKYLQKTFDETSAEKRRFWHSKDIQVPVKQVCWFACADMPEAIRKCLSTLQLATGIRSDFTMWLSSSADCFWISGVGD